MHPAARAIWTAWTVVDQAILPGFGAVATDWSAVARILHDLYPELWTPRVYHGLQLCAAIRAQIYAERAKREQQQRRAGV